MLKINNKSVFITHGIYKIESIGLEIEKGIITIRNTDKYLSIPYKLRKELRKYYYRWFHVRKKIKWLKKIIEINALIDGEIQFTIANCPDEHIMVITLCYHFEDQFERREGVKWVKKRMELALNNRSKEHWWKCILEDE